MKVLENKKPSTNVYLRRVHNFALGMDWLLKPVIPRREWPPVVYGKKRGITLEELHRIIAREGNSEKRDLYELLWHLGGSQSDVADLHAEDVDSPDSRRVVTRAADYVVWDLNTGEKLETLSPLSGYQAGCDFSADGRQLLAGGRNGKGRI